MLNFVKWKIHVLKAVKLYSYSLLPHPLINKYSNISYAWGYWLLVSQRYHKAYIYLGSHFQRGLLSNHFLPFSFVVKRAKEELKLWQELWTQNGIRRSSTPQ